MNLGVIKSRRARVLALAVASTLAVTQAQAQAEAQQPPKRTELIDVVIVTAQKKEENLIDVPIAVSAFNAEALQRKQIDQATDLQLNIPNVSYTKTNFTGSNFQIRGIGVSSVGGSSDSGVETHFNSVPIKSPRLFETEYFDIERVEVLRGPQGTLYGRNATGGAVNVLPKRPQIGDFGGDFEVGAGNYGEIKGKGALNVPMGEIMSLRLAGLYYQRDGYTDNIFTGNDIDGRDQWAARAGFRIKPSDDTDINLTVNHYKEDSSRMRAGKQLCHRDPTGAYGCLPDRLAFEAGNLRGTLGGTLGELLPIVAGAGAVALIAPGTDMNAGAVVPEDYRKVSAEFDPTYEADETIATLEFFHDFGSITLTSVTGYQETTLVSRADYNWVAGTTNYNGGGMPILFGGSIPLSQIDINDLSGSLGGNVVGRFTASTGYDQSDQKADQWSQEFRIASEFDSALNFQLGVFYFEADDDTNYSIATTELDYAAGFLGSQPPIYNNATPLAGLKSTAVFGELYWDMTESWRWTAGLRYTKDDKEIRDRQLLLSVDIGEPLPPFREDETTFEEFTGRFGFDWKPGWFDDSTIYGFYSRGYKAGGFNPPLDRTNPAFTGTPEVYEPEFVDSFEIGSKNLFANGRVQANVGAFYYDYQGLQVSKIVARTSVNENVDATIYGFEGELVFQPVEALQFDLNVSYLNTSINDFSSINPRDPSNGDPNFTVVKDVSTAANYVIPTALLPTARAVGCVLPAQLGGPFGLGALSPACAPFFSDGVAQDLDGNQLPYSPEWSAKIGLQYSFNFGNGMSLTPRVDYYWRDDFYARIFNRPIDQIESWDVLNAQVDLTSADDSWYVRAYVNNAMDDDNITGMYVTDASSGLFTNVFALEPMTYGLAVGFRF